MILKNWTARRAGGRITINGVDVETGGPIKLVGVDSIEPAGTRAEEGVLAERATAMGVKIACIAQDKSLTFHGLVA